MAFLSEMFYCTWNRQDDRLPIAGRVDGDGVLWNAKSEVGKFRYNLEPAMDSMYTSIKASCAKYADLQCVGARPVLARTKVAEGEKLTLGTYEYWTYAEYWAKVESIGSGLSAYLSKGTTAMLYAETAREWMLSAFGCWRCGAVVATCYATLGEDGARFAINQSKATVVLADSKLLRVLANIAESLTTVKTVVTLTDEAADSAAAILLRSHGVAIYTLSEVEAAGRATPMPATPATAQETAVLMYTSGTTGNPKGVLLSHENITAVSAATADGSLREYLCTPGKRFLAYLPLAHIMELCVEFHAFCSGAVVGYGGPGTVLATSPKMLQTSPAQLGDAAAFAPTFFLAAPAVLDRIYAVVNAKIDGAPAPLRAWFRAALDAGSANYDAGTPGAGMLMGLIFRPVQRLLGGQVEIIATGSAPLGKQVAKFCATAFSCPVVQGYGLTETSGATCVGLPMHEHAVGPPQTCACIRLRDWEEGSYRASDAADPAIGMRRGEVLIGGPGVSQGYLVDELAPDAEVVAKNATEYVTIAGVRYFCTGDIAQITRAGNLQIVDRKKDLVKLQHGEYVALSAVENTLKSSSYVQVPLVHAESTKSYCIALICPTPAVRALANDAGLAADTPWANVCANETVTAAVLADLQAVCAAAKLNKNTTPQKCVLIDDEFSPENDMMTAVRKLKRKPIANKHAAQIAKVYV